MLSNFISIVAFRYFRAKKNEKFVSIISGISLAGITIGVAALIVVMSVMNGFHIELTRNIIGLNGEIIVEPIEKAINNHEEVLNKIKAYPFVTKTSKMIQGQALATSKRTSSGALIKGIDLSELKNKKKIIDGVFEGDFTNYDDLDTIAVGLEFAWQHGLQVGSKIKLISPNTISTAFGSMPRARDFTVVAIFNSGFYEYDAATILMPLRAAQVFFSIPDEVNLIEVNTANPEEASKLAKDMQKDLAENGVRILSWQTNNQPFLTALEIERVTMFTILSLIILVAAFNIVSSLFMVVKDKTKDIAILRTIGASRKQIMKIFILNGMMIGTLGTSLGIAIGLLIAKNVESIRKLLETIVGVKVFDPAIYFLYTLPSELKTEDVLLIGCLSISLSFLATIYPAYKASSLNPVEAMRYE